MSRSQGDARPRVTRAAYPDYGVLRRSFFVSTRGCLAPGQALPGTGVNSAPGSRLPRPAESYRRGGQAPGKRLEPRASSQRSGER